MSNFATPAKMPTATKRTAAKTRPRVNVSVCEIEKPVIPATIVA